MSSDRPRILVLDHLDAAALERLRQAGDVTHLPDPAGSDLAGIIADYEAVVIRTSTRLTAQVLERASRLKVIGRAGVGLDNIDLDAAARRGICVVYTPESGTEAVADLTVGMMLSCVRAIHEVHAEVLAGRFHAARGRPPAAQMSELTLGIVGMGRIGRAVGRRCRWGFDMPIVYTDIVEVGRLDFAARSVPLETLLAESDIISLHVPLTDATRRMINEQSIQFVKQRTILINTARGAVVDSAALASALREGSIAAAALDVLDVEPPPPDHPLLLAPHVLLTAHIGARTATAQRKMSEVVDDVIAVLAGRAPRFPALGP